MRFYLYARFQQSKLSDYVGQDSDLIYGPKNEKNNPRFFAGHVEVDGEVVDAGLAQRLCNLAMLHRECKGDGSATIRLACCRS